MATLKFRDNNVTRLVGPSDLVSGAVLAQVAGEAKARAMSRAIRAKEEPGIRMEDVMGALHIQFETQSSILTPENCHLHIDGIDGDAQVVGVECHKRKTARPPVEYLTLQVA